MTSLQDFATAGAIVFVVLTLLHLLVWRVQRTRWSLLLALTYTLAAIVYFFDAALRPGEARGNPVGSTLGAIGLVAMTLALIDYVDLPPRAARIGRWLAIGVAVVVLGSRLAGLLPRIAGSLAYASYFIAMGGMALWAMRREPRRGHGLVLAALLLYPATLLTLVAGWFDPAAMRYVVIIPTAVCGMTILTTGLLRAQPVPPRRWPAGRRPRAHCASSTRAWSSASRNAPANCARWSPGWRASTAASRTTCAGRWAASPASRGSRPRPQRVEISRACNGCCR